MASLSQQIGELTEAVRGLASQVDTLSASVNSLSADQAGTHKWIYGNGEEGAKTKLAVLNERFVSLEKKLSVLTNALLAFIGTLAGGLVMWFLTSVLPDIIKNLPAK